MANNMAAVTHGFGRFNGRAVSLDTCLGISALAALVLVPVLHTPAALLFLLSGTLLFVGRPTSALATLLRYRALLVLPLFCVLSTVWSIYPALSLRYGIQLSATVVIAILIADRIQVSAIILTLFSTLFALVFLSVMLGPYRTDTGALVGLFGSKNEMALAATLFTILSFGLLASPEPPRIIRLCALAGCVLGLSATVLAQSAGALGYLPIGIGAFLSVLLLRRLRRPVRIVAGLFLSLTLALTAIVITARIDAVAAAFFDLTGKDMTLTGRVDLWRVALNLIAERPLLGSGYQAFWVQGHAAAEALWDSFGIDGRAGFNFHNTYLSNAVEIGVIGVLIEAIVLAVAVVQSGRLALMTGSRGAALLFALMVMLATMTLLEAPIFFQFSLWTVLVIVTVVCMSAGLRASQGAN